MKLKYKQAKFQCQICHREFVASHPFCEHITGIHVMQMETYYSKYIKNPDEGICPVCGKPTKFVSLRMGYRKYCSSACECKVKYDKIEPHSIICAICGTTVAGSNKLTFSQRFAKHLKTTHKTNLKNYYDTYLKKPEEGICRYCGNPTNFRNFYDGYYGTCSKACAIYHIRKEQDAAEREFKKEIKELKKIEQEEIKNKEEEYQKLCDDLQARADAFEWEGERNTWETGHKINDNKNKNNLLTDNSISYIDGQNYSAKCQTITENKENSFNYEGFVSELLW